MGDIHCKVCGEPWDSFGVHNGDMTAEEKKTFLEGRGCPCCKGKPIYDCTREDNKDIEPCGQLSEGKCISTSDCGFKQKRGPYEEKFLGSLVEEAERDEDLGVLFDAL